MLKKDVLHNKAITIVLFFFIMLSAFLVASGANLIVELANSMNALFAKSKAPHFVQMHAGEVNQADLDAFAASNRLVKAQQTAEMVHIDGLNMELGNRSAIDRHSLMDHYFVKQNDAFDLLLNVKNEVIRISQGEVAVPIYYRQKENIQTGDKVAISTPQFDMELTVADFVRDVQMNPSIIHSKRFVIHDADFNVLKKNIGNVEYLIEFRLADLNKLNEFRNEYASANLPKKGPAIDFHLFKTLNAITDGITAAVIIFVSLLINIIALLCIRFAILSAIEEDYRQIGVLKAMGMRHKDIRKIYFLKYIVLAAAASLFGYIASLFLNRLFTSHVDLYIGAAPKSILAKMIPAASVIFLLLLIVLFCTVAFRRLHNISAVEALRSGHPGEAQRFHKKFLALHRSKLLHLHLFLGLRDVFAGFKMYRLLLLVFVLCSFIMIVPINFLHTIQTPDFIQYMGVERSDIRIDIQQTDNMDQQFKEVVMHMESDEDIQTFAQYVTSRYTLISRNGLEENIHVETGDFSVFPLEYAKGGPPIKEDEIALSYLNAKELGKNVGDPVVIAANGQERELTVSGIYQDVTNGGRTAKALLPENKESVLWYKVILNVKPHVHIRKKMDEYANLFYPVKVTDLNGYVSQTFGNTMEQLRTFTVIAIAVALLVSVLITSLFLKMLLAKDRLQIAIMKSIGFSLRDIRTQYVARIFIVLLAGIIAGTMCANTIGEKMASALMSLLGASDIQFVIDPLKAYILCPLILMIVVAITTILSAAPIKKNSMADINAG
jgi:putative ABC transport system permease protein